MSFERLALPHMQSAYNLARALMSSPTDAEDVVQEAYLNAFKSFASFRGQDVRPWLLAIVRNAAYGMLRARRRAGNVVAIDWPGRDHHEDLPHQVASQEATAEERMIAAIDAAYVWQALAELPAPMREVLVLRELEEMRYQDIADVMSLPMGTVMSRLSRARRELGRAVRRLNEKDERSAV